MAHESSGARPVQLHVIHDLGGGSAKWLVDFSNADTARTNLVLRPFAHDAAMGAGVALFADATAEAPLEVWKFAERIDATVPQHAGYSAALREIIEAHGVQALIVSSLIGHSLEALETGLPTLVVCHDYFPWCPAINLHYGQVCGKCDGARVAECHQDNPDYNPFSGFEPPARIAARERYVELVRRPWVRLVVPSASVAQNRKIQLRSVKATLEAGMDMQGILGIDSEVRNGFDGIKVTFYVDADATRAEIAALVAQSQRRSAVFDIITNPTNVRVEVA